MPGQTYAISLGSRLRCCHSQSLSSMLGGPAKKACSFRWSLTPFQRIVLSMAIAALLLPDEVENRRREPRYRVRLELMPVDLCHDSIRVTIEEVSATGLLLHSEQALQAGSILTLELSGTERKVANIVWVRQRLYGVEFAKPLTSDELQRLRKASTVVWPRFRDSPEAKIPKSRASLEDALRTDYQDVTDEAKLPLPQRLGIIFGSTSVLWAVIFGGVWLAAR